MKKEWLAQDWTQGELNALLKKLGEENARQLMSGDLVLKTGEGGAELVKAVKKLFDKNGRRIPPKGLEAAVCDPDRDICFKQLDSDYGSRYAHYCEFSGHPDISPEEFQRRSEELIASLKADEQLANLLKGVCLPILVPKLANGFDYGQVMEEGLRVVEKAYCRAFPDREFCDCLKGELAGKVKVAHPSHEMLIKISMNEPRVGLYFPNPLQGFSVKAARAQMSDLPMELSLSGGLDTMVAMAMYPDVLARDHQTPGLDMAALSWGSSGDLLEDSLGFKAEDAYLYFARGASLSIASGCDSAGLLFLG